MTRGIDHYATLGIGRYAGDNEIRAAYLAKVKACHPDLSQEADRMERFARLQLAYACLRDPDRRAVYDQHAMATVSYELRKMQRAKRRLRKLDRRFSLAVGRLRLLVVGIILGGTLALSAYYLID